MPSLKCADFSRQASTNLDLDLPNHAPALRPSPTRLPASTPAAAVLHVVVELRFEVADQGVQLLQNPGVLPIPLHMKRRQTRIYIYFCGRSYLEYQPVPWPADGEHGTEGQNRYFSYYRTTALLVLEPLLLGQNPLLLVVLEPRTRSYTGPRNRAPHPANSHRATTRAHSAASFAHSGTKPH